MTSNAFCCHLRTIKMRPAPAGGAEVHIMIGNKESCKQAAIDAAEEAKQGLADNTVIAKVNNAIDTIS